MASVLNVASCTLLLQPVPVANIEINQNPLRAHHLALTCVITTSLKNISFCARNKSLGVSRPLLALRIGDFLVTS